MSNNGTIRSYAVGFALSILFTLAAYFAVVNHVLSGEALISLIIGLALVQFVVQLIFFLHLGQEENPRWNLAVLLSTISVVLVLVVGSIWIMGHLNYNMTPSDMDRYMLQQEGIQK